MGRKVISFSDFGWVLGERCNKMPAEEKAPYEAKAPGAKKRFHNEMSSCKNLQATNIDSGNESDRG